MTESKRKKFKFKFWKRKKDKRPTPIIGNYNEVDEVISDEVFFDTIIEKGETMKTGTVVWANLDGKKDVLGLFVKDAGDKDVIQVGVEDYSLTYREPEDRDANGAGKTWWKVA